VDRSTPTTATFVIATAILAGLAGFFIGQGSSLGSFSRSFFSSSSKPRKSWPNSYDVKVHADSSDSGGGREDAETDDSGEDDDCGGGELATFKGNTDEVKLVLVVRTDLGMGKGEN
jgi:PTH2 family peptidyl-tRNA hydrolase